MESTDESEQEPGAEGWQAWRTKGLIWFAVITVIFFVGRFTPIAPIQSLFGSFNWLTKQAIEIVSDLFESNGNLVVFLGPLLENTLFIGAIVPGTIVMLFAGVAAENGIISFWPAILLGIAGAIIGDTISYSMGRFGRRRLGPESRLAKWSERMRDPLMHHSVWIVLSYHFAGYSRLVGPAAAGFLRMPFFRWAMLDYAGVTVWVISFLTGGYVLAKTLDLELGDAAGSDRNVQIFEVMLFALFAIAIFSVFRATARQRKERRETSAASRSSDGDDPGPLPAPAPADKAVSDGERREPVR